MEFITVEQFKEQPIEVQKVFLDWWKPSTGDIYSYDYILCCLTGDLQVRIVNIEKYNFERIPLFTEGQLRKFIEDKTYMEIEILKSSSVGKCVGTMFYDRKVNGNAPKYKVDEVDLFQAYWKVACIVAEEGLNG